MEDNTNSGQSGAEDQNLDTGADQGTNDTGTDQGADTGAGDGKPTPYESQKRRAEIAETNANTYKQQLIDAGVLDKDGKPKTKSQSNSDEGQQAPNYATLEQRTVRAELAAYGVKDRTEQDFVIGAAKRLGIDASEAASDPIVVARLEKMREDRKVKDATPPPSKGGGAPRNTGKLPDFSKMSNKEFDEWEKKNR